MPQPKKSLVTPGLIVTILIILLILGAILLAPKDHYAPKDLPVPVQERRDQEPYVFEIITDRPFRMTNAQGQSLELSSRHDPRGELPLCRAQLVRNRTFSGGQYTLTLYQDDWLEFDFQGGDVRMWLRHSAPITRLTAENMEQLRFFPNGDLQIQDSHSTDELYHFGGDFWHLESQLHGLTRLTFGQDADGQYVDIASETEDWLFNLNGMVDGPVPFTAPARKYLDH